MFVNTFPSKMIIAWCSRASEQQGNIALKQGPWGVVEMLNQGLAFAPMGHYCARSARLVLFIFVNV